MPEQWLIEAASLNRSRQKQEESEYMSWRCDPHRTPNYKRRVAWHKARLYEMALAMPAVPRAFYCYYPPRDGLTFWSRAQYVDDLYAQVWHAWYMGAVWAWPYGDFVLAYAALPRSEAREICGRWWNFSELSGWWQLLMLFDNLPNPYVLQGGSHV